MNEISKEAHRCLAIELISEFQTVNIETLESLLELDRGKCKSILNDLVDANILLPANEMGDCIVVNNIGEDVIELVDEMEADEVFCIEDHD